MEVCGRAQVTEDCVLHIQAKLDVLNAKPRPGEGSHLQVHTKPLIITVTPTHCYVEPQSILVDTGGVLGIKISAVTMQLCLNPPQCRGYYNELWGFRYLA